MASLAQANIILPVQVVAEVPNDVESIMIDVTKADFIRKSNDFIERVSKATWIAMDEEMTGIMIPNGPRPGKDQTPSQRYDSFKQVSERYGMIQWGVCLFERKSPDSEHDYHVRRYKFTLFPGDSSQREVLMNPASMKFLSANHMDFNLWVQEGLGFCTGEMATKMATQWLEDYQNNIRSPKNTKEEPPSPHLSRQIELTRLEDKQFHARGMSNLREWLDSPAMPGPDDLEGTSFLLPPCNSFLRRAFYESIPREYPFLVVETVKESSQLRIWRLTREEKVLREKRLVRESWERLVTEKVGVYRIFLALTKACRGQAKPKSLTEHILLAPSVTQAMTPFEHESSNMESNDEDDDEDSFPPIPLVVHNGMQDLLFLLTHFHYKNKLPDTWAETKQTIHSFFPVVFDTKIIVTEFAPREWKARGATHLAALYELALARQPQWNRVFQEETSASGVPDHHRQQQQQQQQQMEEQCHDASFDAYMTGVAFYAACVAIYRDPQTSQHTSLPWLLTNKIRNRKGMDEATWYYGCNKMYFYLSPYTIDLANPTNHDPLGRGMDPKATFRVSGIDPSVTTRDIVRCLSALVDDSGQRVNFEIVWVDDTTFLVAAMLPECKPDDELFLEHGKAIFQALQRRFSKENVRPFMEDATPGDPAPSLWNLWGLLGGSGAGSNKKRGVDDASSPSSSSRKRRRVA